MKDYEDELALITGIESFTIRAGTCIKKAKEGQFCLHVDFNV